VVNAASGDSPLGGDANEDHEWPHSKDEPAEPAGCWARLERYSIPNPLDHKELLHEIVKRTRHDGAPIYTGPQHRHSFLPVQIENCRQQAEAQQHGGTSPYGGWLPSELFGCC